MGQWTELETPAGSVAAWQADPPGTPRGGLVVIQEIFGVSPHIRAVADGYAAEGYVVLAPAFFDPVSFRRVTTRSRQRRPSARPACRG